MRKGPSGFRYLILASPFLFASLAAAAGLDGPRPSAPMAGADRDAQQVCVAPVNDFQRQLDEAVGNESVPEAFRASFLRLVDSCREVYLYELAKLEADFADMPETSYCHQTTSEFRQAVEVIDGIGDRARLLPMDTAEESLSAASFFSMTGPGLVRAVNGLFLLRHGICMEEEVHPAQ